MIPPLRTFAARWITHNPINNIDDGEVGAGGVNRISCATVRQQPAIQPTERFIQSEALAEKVVERLTVQSTPTYRLALEGLNGLSDALQSGRVPQFVSHATQDCFPKHFQLSEVPHLQLTIIHSSSKLDEESAREVDASDESGSTVKTSTIQTHTTTRHAPEIGVQVPEMIQSKPENSEPTSKIKSEVVAYSASAPEDRKQAEISPQVGSKEAPFEVASPVRRLGMSSYEKRTKDAKEIEAARRFAAEIRDEKKTRKVRLDDAAALLEGSYSMHGAEAMVTALDLPHVDVSGPLTVRPYNIGEEVPVIKAIPQLDKIEEAIQAIKETGNPDLLAHWPDYGCAALDHLDTMASTIEARHRFGLDRYTLAWIEKITWRSSVVVDPFKDTCDVTKTEHKAIVEKMNLGVTNVCGQRVREHQLLDFRENLWLHSTSILAGMMILRGEYRGVAVVDPSFHNYYSTGHRTRIAGCYGAVNPSNTYVISIINVDKEFNSHWCAFLVEIGSETCFTFDP